VYLSTDGLVTRVYSISRGTELQFTRCELQAPDAAVLDVGWSARLPQLSHSMISPAHIFDEVGWVAANDLNNSGSERKGSAGNLTYKISGKLHSFSLASVRPVVLSLTRAASVACKEARGAVAPSCTMWLAADATVHRIQLVVADSFGLPFDEQRLTLLGVELTGDAQVVQDFLPAFITLDSRVEVTVGIKNVISEDPGPCQ